MPDIEYAKDEYAADTGADALVFPLRGNQFRALDRSVFRQLKTQIAIFENYELPIGVVGLTMRELELSKLALQD